MILEAKKAQTDHLLTFLWAFMYNYYSGVAFGIICNDRRIKFARAIR
jgi:hypothetical protein